MGSDSEELFGSITVSDRFPDSDKTLLFVSDEGNYLGLYSFLCLIDFKIKQSEKFKLSKIERDCEGDYLLHINDQEIKINDYGYGGPTKGTSGFEVFDKEINLIIKMQRRDNGDFAFEGPGLEKTLKYQDKLPFSVTFPGAHGNKYHLELIIRL